jgi:hypothetical protein
MDDYLKPARDQTREHLKPLKEALIEIHEEEGRDMVVLLKDGRGVFVPTRKEILLQRCPKSISTGDTKFFSLQYFIKLCLNSGEVGLEMLDSEEIVYQNKHLWGYIRELRTEVRYWDQFIIDYYNYVVTRGE